MPNEAIPGRELFIGLVGAVGTDLSKVSNLLEEILLQYAYLSFPIRLAELLGTIERYSKSLRNTPADDYITSHMDAGDRLRLETGRDDALAVLALSKVGEARTKSGIASARRAFILRSLKHQDEINVLREIYGDSFYVVAAYAPRDLRRSLLSQRISQSRGVSPPEKFLAKAEELMWRDQTGSDRPYGQHVSEAFHRADVFVDASDSDLLRSSLSRFVALVFGDTLNTPLRSEYSMFHAKAAALRSSELGRQVGACISTDEGDVVSLGTNEVPHGGGGLYWSGDKPDVRQFQVGTDSNDAHKQILIQDTLARLKEAGWLRKDLLSMSGEELAKAATTGEARVFSKESRIANLIEFGRAVHAEMAALVDAARRGVSVKDCTMYVTTFPCHLCARHIVAAGIKQVVYIEPYPKSLTTELYPDSITVENDAPNDQVVRFLPFVGISPRQYLRLFEASKRKDSTTGKVLRLDMSIAAPRFSAPEAVYLEREKTHLRALLDELKRGEA